MSGGSGHGEDCINTSQKPSEDFEQGSNVNILTFSGGKEVDEMALDTYSNSWRGDGGWK